MFMILMNTKKKIFRSDAVENRPRSARSNVYCLPYNDRKKDPPMKFKTIQIGKYLKNIRVNFVKKEIRESLFLITVGQNIFINIIPKFEIII